MISISKQRKLIEEENGAASNFIDVLRNDKNYEKYLDLKESEMLKEIELSLSYNLRYYQKEAILSLSYITELPHDNWFKMAIKEKIGGNEIPFYGFEMATGSGKTLLMGASIIYLYKKYGTRNFLIIVPSNEIYKKTIANFSPLTSKSVFSGKVNMKFNIITGENYKDRSSDFIPDPDFNIFIFTIQSFFERSDSGAVLNVDKAWEGSPWVLDGNTISLREYLKMEKLIIITDEAHHYQKFRVGHANKGSLDIIADFEPSIVLEFTATAVSNSHSDMRRTQKIIYEYGLKKFIEDGYGKKIRAFGYNGSSDYSNNSDVTEDDLKKIILSIMVHIVKKKALGLLGPQAIKPIIVVRARDTQHADRLGEELKGERIATLAEETYRGIVNGPKYDITELIRNHVGIDELHSFIETCHNVSFVYHSGNDSQEEIMGKIGGIESNDQEIIIQVKKLEEGWDLVNPYTILILHNGTGGEVRTYVRQMIGRGVRLFREQRIQGDLSGRLEEQQEILHVISNKGSNFDLFISNLREEMGLSGEDFKEETFSVEKSNKINMLFEENHSKLIPLIELKRKFSPSPDLFLKDLNYEALEINQWVIEHTRTIDGSRFFTFEEESSPTERDLVTNDSLERGSSNYNLGQFSLDPVEIGKFSRVLVEKLPVLPSSDKTREKLISAILRINSEGIKYADSGKNSGKIIALKTLQELENHIKKVINSKFESTVSRKKVQLSSIFPDSKIILEATSSEMTKYINLKKWNELGPLDKIKRSDLIGGKEIYGFERSWYEYNSFDSGQEFRFACILDQIDGVDFWIRNKRQMVHYYSYYKYYPDFLVKSGDRFYLIEVKGSDKLETPRVKNELKILDLIRNDNESIMGALFFQDKTVDEKLFGHAKTFDDIISNDDFDRIYLLNGLGNNS